MEKAREAETNTGVLREMVVRVLPVLRTFKGNCLEFIRHKQWRSSCP